MFDETNIHQLRSATVVDRDGSKVGNVQQVYLDDTTGRPSWVTVNTGLFGTRETFVPLDRATQDGETVRLPYEKSFIKDAPNLDVDEHLEPSHEEELYRYYAIGGDAAAATRRDRDVVDRNRGERDLANRDVTDWDVNDADVTGRDRNVTDRDSEAATTLHEERLNVGTERREAGRVRLRKYVVTDTETVDVPVQREELRVERERVGDQPARPGGLDVDRDRTDETIVLHEEHPVVEKETVATERVRVGKETVTDREQVTTDVSREEADLEGGTEVRGRRGIDDAGQDPRR